MKQRAVTDKEGRVVKIKLHTAAQFQSDFLLKKRRILKFRGWNPDFGMIYPTAMRDDGVMLDPHNGFFSDREGIDHPHIVPLQFTGMRDRNGTEIYEADIVATQLYSKRSSHNSKGGFARAIGVVRYRVSALKSKNRHRQTVHDYYEADWYVHNVDPNFDSVFRHGTWGDFYDCKVIGNVFEHPHILKEGIYRE